MTQYLQVDTEAGVARVTLCDPASLNALNPGMAAELTAAFRGFAADGDVRAVVLAGSGKHFSAGGNLHAARQASGSQAAADGFMAAFNDMILAVWECPVPVIAAARGSVAGGALGLMLCADTVILGLGARLLQAFIHIGLAPDCGTSVLLAQRVGAARAADLSYTGRTVNATEAVAMGLGEYLLPDDAIEAAALNMARSIAGKSAVAIRQAKALLRAPKAAELRDALAQEGRVQSVLLQTDGFRQRVDAFIQKKVA